MFINIRINFICVRIVFILNKISICQFNFMDIQTFLGLSPLDSFSPPNKQTKTPSTISCSLQSEHYNQNHYKTVSEFTLDIDTVNLNTLMNNTTLDQKENHKHTTDRFIPLRKAASMDAAKCFPSIDPEQQTSRKGQEVKEDKLTLEQMYRCVLLEKNNSKMFTFGSTQKTAKTQTQALENGFCQSSDRQLLKEGHLLIQSKLQKRCSDPEYRKISKLPFKVLDGPSLQDDFYLNLLQWSSQNILSVALDTCLYFWNANNNKVIKFCDLAPDSISSLNWNHQGSHIAIGTSKGTVELWDATKNCRINQYSNHSARVSSVAWADNILASGSRDRTIKMRDMRERNNRICNTYLGHTQQVCGLKWSLDHNMLASGGNDNKLFIWSPHSTMPIGKYNDHCAAVKGIAWSPHNHGVLASGGGSADKTIKFWNTLNNTLLDSIDTGSQVCNLMFSKNTKQIVSTHGYSNNQIIVWKYPSLQKLATLTGHTSRVLFLAINPTGETIVTGAGDQTLRFWNVFPSKAKKENRSNRLSTMELR